MAGGTLGALVITAISAPCTGSSGSGAFTVVAGLVSARLQLQNALPEASMPHSPTRAKFAYFICFFSPSFLLAARPVTENGERRTNLADAAKILKARGFERSNRRKRHCEPRRFRLTRFLRTLTEASLPRFF